MACLSQIQSIPALQTQFPGKFPLGAPVPFPERVQRVEVSIMLRKHMDEPFRIFLHAHTILIICWENGLGIRSDVLDEAKHTCLCNIHCPDFSSPRIQILEDMIMDTAKVVEIKVPTDGLLVELVQPYGHKTDLSLA